MPHSPHTPTSTPHDAPPQAPRRVLRIGAAAAATAMVALAAPASAHVGITPSTTEAGAHAILTLSVPHGCESSPTTRVEISIPEQILSVTPTRNPLWKVTKTRETLAEPVTDAHGNTVTERDATVVYTARTPLPEGYRDAFELSVQLPDEEGATLAFPAVQTCKKGETPWTEVAAEGQDPHELENPAPVFTLTAAAGDDDGDVADSTDTDDEPQPAETTEQQSGTLGGLGLGAGLLGLAAGATALWQVRRRT